ncbi:hypothetical protein HDZ31DRAFT_83699 [Schizophyllum fasciatum]
MSNIVVRRLKNATDAEIERIVAVNVAAFANDAFSRVLVGGNMDLLPLLMRAHVEAGLIGGEVYVAGDGPDDIASAAVWFGPGQELLYSIDLQATGFGELMGSVSDATRGWWQDKFLPFNEATAAAFGEGLKKDNWHLELLATEPRSQHKGLATALIQEVGHIAWKAGKSLTVETDTEDALAFYKATGFALKAKKPVLLEVEGAEGDVERPIPMYVLWKIPEGRLQSDGTLSLWGL